MVVVGHVEALWPDAVVHHVGAEVPQGQFAPEAIAPVRDGRRQLPVHRLHVQVEPVGVVRNGQALGNRQPLAFVVPSQLRHVVSPVHVNPGHVMVHPSPVVARVALQTDEVAWVRPPNEGGVQVVKTITQT